MIGKMVDEMIIVGVVLVVVIMAVWIIALCKAAALEVIQEEQYLGY